MTRWRQSTISFLFLKRRCGYDWSCLQYHKKTVLHARYYLGMAVNEIAEVEGVDPSRVRDSIRRGLKQLVKYF